jgi:hypothetical protein
MLVTNFWLVLASLEVAVSFLPTPKIGNQNTLKVPTAGRVLFSSPEDDKNEIENPLERLNSLLDTPILDANNKQNQGPVVEALKNFVRDDAELASLTFSVVVVIFFGVLTRGAMYMINGY